MKLLDSNILIYSGEPSYSSFLLDYVSDTANIVSVISKIETLGFLRITPAQTLYFESLFTVLQSVGVNDAIVTKAIELRQHRKMSLGDSLIGATALVYNAVLVTRNIIDFSGIPGLSVINPIP